jgi:hypothetical protein
MALGRRAPLPRKRLVVKDKFHRKKDWAFLDARNARCALAAKLLGDCACVFLDSPKLGTSRALLKAGVPASQIFPVNGRDEGGFSRKAQRLGVRPVVSMFHAAATESLELRGRKDLAVCYNDGTHGDPDLVWRDMSPWLRRLPRDAYVSYTFSIRSRNAVPATASFGVLLMLAGRGFQPPGGWQRLREAFTFDGRMFNVQLLRGLEGRQAGKLAALAGENGYSLSERYLKAPKQEAAPRSPSELRRLARELSRRRKEVAGRDREAFLKRWQQLRSAVALLGAKGEREVLGQLPEASWVRQQYRKWLSSSSGSLSKDLIRRFPHRRKAAEAAHWQTAARWVSRALQQHSPRGQPSLLVSAEAHPHFPSYLAWLRSFLSEQQLRRTLCVLERGLPPGVKANVTRRRSAPLRTERSLQQLRDSGSQLLPCKPARFEAALLPLLAVGSYEEALGKLESLVAELSERCVLVVHLRSSEALCTLAWAVSLVARLAASSRFRLADCCELAEDGSELLDYSRILTLVLSRGL